MEFPTAQHAQHTSQQAQQEQPTHFFDPQPASPTGTVNSPVHSHLMLDGGTDGEKGRAEAGAGGGVGSKEKCRDEGGEWADRDKGKAKGGLGFGGDGKDGGEAVQGTRSEQPPGVPGSINFSQLTIVLQEVRVGACKDRNGILPEDHLPKVRMCLKTR